MLLINNEDNISFIINIICKYIVGNCTEFRNCAVP